jgi:hypothetical protein
MNLKKIVSFVLGDNQCFVLMLFQDDRKTNVLVHHILFAIEHFLDENDHIHHLNVVAKKH